MQVRRKKEEADDVLFEFCSHYKENKRNYKCKTVVSMDINPMPTEFKAIDEENGEVFYVS